MESSSIPPTYDVTHAVTTDPASSTSLRGVFGAMGSGGEGATEGVADDYRTGRRSEATRNPTPWAMLSPQAQ